jgi:threonine/homoserine/homoserine lactone efflux protein
VRPSPRDERKEPDSRFRLFANVYLVTALNPKGIVFYLVFVPQFIDAHASLAPQLAVLVPTFVVLATVNAALYATFADRARRLFVSAPARRRFNLLGGSLLSGAGIWALLSRRTA